MWKNVAFICAVGIKIRLENSWQIMICNILREVTVETNVLITNIVFFFRI